MGDLNHVKPVEKQVITKLEDIENDEEVEPMMSAVGPQHASHAQLSAKDSSSNISVIGGGGVAPTGPQDIDNMVIDEMVDINRFRYQGRLSNIIYSTCPIIPKFHTTFGEPIDR